MKPALIVVALLSLFNLYLVYSFRWKVGSGAGVTALITVFFFGFFALQLVAPLLDWSLAPIGHTFAGEAYEALVRASYLALGALSCLFVYSVVADAGGFVLIWLAGAKAESWVKPLLFMIVALATTGTLYVGQDNAGRVETIRVDMPLAKLPSAFDGFTIAQISDLHIGAFLRRDFVQSLADEIGRLSPDVVVLTGDIADGTPDKLLPELMPLASLHPPHGLYYVTGNHEYYWGASLWTDAVRRLGFRVLTNENVVFEKDGRSLTLAGVPDITSLRMEMPPYPDPVKARLGAPVGAPAILLSHQPKTLSLAKKAGFAAQISGHTHAGQYFPFTWIIHLFEPYRHGLYDSDGFKLYVNKGAGFWGPPLRTGGPGEITLITLRESS